MRFICTALLLILFTLALAAPGQALTPAGAAQQGDQSGSRSTAILADPADAYYALAQEIAQEESLTLYHTLDEVLVQSPAFLLWVASPASLSDAVMVEYGVRVRDLGTSLSMGILSGTTIDEARRLWLRAGEVEGEVLVGANAGNPSAGIQAGMTTTSPEGVVREPLSRANLVARLREADYLTFTGHGSGHMLRLDGGSTTLRTTDVPPLEAMVIATGNCNSFRPWEADSLPLAFVRQGAAAFVGFVYSPVEGFLLGQYDALPLRYTWPEFPVGHAVQVQSRGAGQGFAQVPYLFLMGDPRQSLQAAPPYELISDRSGAMLSEVVYVEPWRVLSYRGAPAGVMPVKVPGGARWDFVEIPGVSAAWEGDPFYNARLQMVDIGEDKYILFLHSGGDFSVRLQLEPRWFWVAGDLALDALDNSLLFMPQGGGDWLMLAAAGVALIPFLWVFLRRPKLRRAVVPALVVGLGFAVAHGLYSLIRLPQVTMISKPVRFSPAALGATFLWVSMGAFLYLGARRGWGKALGLVVALLPNLMPAAVNLVFATSGNWGVFGPTLGVSLYNGHLGLQASMAVALLCVVLGFVLVIVRRRFRAAVRTAV